MRRWIFVILVACALTVGAAEAYIHFGNGVAKAWDDHQLASKAGPKIIPVPAASGKGTTRPYDLFKVFAAAPPIESGQLSDDDLEKALPAFGHQPFNAAGFDAMMVPFTYEDPNHLGDPNEAMALEALMSNDLDWSPGCYCARHAFFIFKRDEERIRQYQRRGDAQLLATLIQYWGATHAIGGKVIRSAKGYSGTLVIYSYDGQIEYVQHYDQPRSYWDLLGDMDVDAMTHLDVKPSAKLADYLHEPRCKNWQSVVDFGSTAFAEEKSEQEFGTYRKILQADPDFAFVRHWYASQKCGMDTDWAARTMEDARSLASRVEPAALDEITPAYITDPKLAGLVPDWISKAADLIGEDSPQVCSWRLSLNYLGPQNINQAVEHGIKVAGKYSNSHGLQRTLAALTPDHSLGASLLLASLLNYFRPGYDDSAEVRQGLAYLADEINRPDIAMQMISGQGAEQPESNLNWLIIYLTDAGHYSEAANFYQLLKTAQSREVRASMAPNAAFSAAVVGDKATLDQILSSEADALSQEDLEGVFRSYRDTLDGKDPDVAALVRASQILNFATFWRLLLVARCDGMHGVSANHAAFTQLLLVYPVTRLAWIAQDQYQRFDPSNDGGAFYDYLGWLFSNDPWVAGAVADFRARGGVVKTVDPKVLRTDLNEALINGPYVVDFDLLDWNHVLTPWRVAACVHQLVTQGKTADARDMARLYREFTLLSTDTQITTAAAMIERRIDGMPN